MKVFQVLRVTKSLKNQLGRQVGTNIDGKLAHVGGKIAKVGPKMCKVRPKMAQDGPKMA